MAASASRDIVEVRGNTSRSNGDLPVLPAGVRCGSEYNPYTVRSWWPIGRHGDEVVVVASVPRPAHRTSVRTRAETGLMFSDFPRYILLIPQFCPHRQRTGVQQQCRDVCDWPRGATAVHVGSRLYRMCPYGPQTHNRRTRFSEII